MTIAPAVSCVTSPVQEYEDGASTPSVEYIRGDVVAATNASGSLTYQAAYEAFGQHGTTDSSAEWTDGATPLDRQQGNTKDEDPTGLLNEGFRYRDLETGTFITPDPLGYIDGPNVYTYVVQNPWTKFDPLGLTETVITNAQAAKLKDSAPGINKFVNHRIQEAYKLGPAGIRKQGFDGIKQYMKEHIGRPSSIGGNDTTLVQRLRNSDESFSGYFLEGEFEGSKYEGSPMHKLHSMGMMPFDPVTIGLNIDGEAIGGDKLDHMFYDGFKVSHLPEHSARAESESGEKGINGLKSSGVYSHADVEANMVGWKFYNDLEKSFNEGVPYTFDITSFNLEGMNENKNKNEYSASMQRTVEKNTQEEEETQQ